MTLADRVACGLVVAAGVFAGIELARRDAPALGVAVGLVAVVLALMQARSWTQSSTRPPLRLHWVPAGGLRVQVGSEPPCTATLGPATRLLGGTVLLDLRHADRGAVVHYRKWLTRYDVPAGRLRRWTVVLPSSGRVACS